MQDAPDMRRLTLDIGGTTKEVLLARLRESGVKLNDLALGLFADPRFTTSATTSKVQVARVSVASLGLPDGGKFAELVERAATAGLACCPLELGPHLRLAWPEQPEEGADGLLSSSGRAPPGSVTVVSAPLDHADETPKGFYLRRIDGSLWLRAYRSWSGHVWSPGDVLAFIER